MNVPSLPDRSNSPRFHQDWWAIIRQTTVWMVRATGFWLAVVLPFLYLPLVFRGFASQGELLAFAGLVLLNLAALVVGHGYRR